MAGASVHLVPYGPPARETLREALAEAKQDDPLAPVTVAVPSNYAGLSLRRALAREGLPGARRPGLINVRFMVLARVSELIGAPGLAAAGRRRLIAPYRIEAVRAVVEANPGPFASVAIHGSTERSIEATFRDLAAGSDGALAELERLGGRAAHIVALYRDFRHRTRDFYDEADLARAAARAVSAHGAAVADIGRVIVYLPGSLTGAHHELLEALAAAGQLSVIVGLTGDPMVDEPARDGWRAFAPIAEPAEPSMPPAGGAIVAVTDPEEEVREAMRQVSRRLLAGTPLHRMAILYRHANPYALIAAELMGAAELPWNGPSTRRLGQTLAGRTLLGFLRLREQGFRREAVTGWLSGAPLLDVDGGDPLPAHRWDALTRAAGVVAGAEQWRRRLDQHQRSLRADRAKIDDAGEDQEWLIRRIDRDLEEIARLRTFVEELVDRAATERARPWSEFSAWARGALDRYLGGEARATGWPDGEIEAYRDVRAALDELAGLDVLRGATDAATFYAAVEHSLDRAAGRAGRFGDGVFVGSLADAAGADFDVVFVLGMNEGSIPPMLRDDPLLPDGERRQAGVQLRSRRAVEERRDYLAALAAGAERVLLFPRADMRGQRARLPGRWLLDSASALAGEHVFASELDRHAAASWFHSVPSFEWAVAGEGEPALVQEYDLRSLLRWRGAGRDLAEHYLAGQEPALAGGLAARLARRSRAFTRWDGHVPAAAARSPFAADTVVSPTSLQSWAECPFRYFLGHMLRVAEHETPEETLRISALDKGSLVHRALDRFFHEVPERTAPDEPWTPEERARLEAIGEQECDDAERSGIAGRPLMWEAERARILRDLGGFLDRDEELRLRLGTVQVASELAFGMDGAAPVTVEVAPGRRVRLRGRVDRVDRSPDGERLVVIDYKTGAVWSAHDRLDEDPVSGGLLLQLPVYAAAARERYRADVVESRYWFVTERGEFAERGYVVDAARSERFQEALHAIGEGIEGGVFPLRPGPEARGVHEHCRSCPYTTLCPGDRGRNWQRKRDAPEIAGYLELAEPGERS